MIRSRIEVIICLAAVSIAAALFVGYVLNIVELLTVTPMGVGEMIVRTIGIFIPPLGGIIGYI